MRSTLVVACVVLAVANAAVVPLGFTLAPKIPVTTTVPVITNVPVTVPSCGCGIEVSPFRSCGSCGCLDAMLPTCGCLDSVLPTCGCLDSVLPSLGMEISTICGCGFDGCGCGRRRSSCLTVDPVTTCGCTMPLPVLDVIPSLNPMLGVVPACGCGCGRVISACGCPTLPPFPPTIGCCGKFLRQVCVQPPFL